MEVEDWEKLNWQMDPEDGVVRFDSVFNGVKIQAVLETRGWNVSVGREHETSIESADLDSVARSLAMKSLKKEV